MTDSPCKQAIARNMSVTIKTGGLYGDVFVGADVGQALATGVDLVISQDFAPQAPHLRYKSNMANQSGQKWKGKKK